MPAFLITFDHFANSLRMNAANRSEEIGATSPPSAASFSFTSGRPRMRTTSRFRRATISAGIQDLAAEMSDRAGAGRAERKSTGARFRGSDEILHRLDR